MRKQILSLCAIIALAGAAYAGTETYSGKETKTAVEPPCPEFYADNEFNVSLFGAYAFEGTNDRRTIVGDNAYGGGIDATYFFRRYFGVGIESYALASDRGGDDDSDSAFNNGDDDEGVYGLTGHFTLRYPFPCSRFAPYTFVGGGVVFHDNDGDFDFDDDDDDEFFGGDDDDARGLFTAGIGFEVRFSRHIGLINDFRWNVVNGQRNNFGMFRTGINFAF